MVLKHLCLFVLWVSVIVNAENTHFDQSDPAFASLPDYEPLLQMFSEMSKDIWHSSHNNPSNRFKLKNQNSVSNFNYLAHQDKALMNDEASTPSTQEAKRSALRNAITRRSHKTLEKNDNDSYDKKEKFFPKVSVGEFYASLFHLKPFFDTLKSNMLTVESKSAAPHLEFIPPSPTYFEEPVAEAYRSEYMGDSQIRPTGTAAFLHAIRTYRPSQRVRALVSMQPDDYKGANFHDPNFLWAGLGK